MNQYICYAIEVGAIVALILLVRWILKPYFAKRHYLKYPNVDVNPNASIIYGDDEDQMEEESIPEYLANLILAKPDIDLKVFFEYRLPMVFLTSSAAIKEFKKLYPEKIDRCDFEKRSFAKMYPKAFDKVVSNDDWRRRQQLFFKSGVLKQPQSLIPLMVDCLEERINDWQKGEKIDFADEFSDLANEIITIAMFGEKFYDHIGDCRYKKRDGTVTSIPFNDAVQEIPDDCSNSYESLLASIFPVINDKSLIEPFKTDAENINEVYRVLRNYLIKHGKKGFTDIEILKNIDPKLKEIDMEYFLNDIFALFDAGIGGVLLALAGSMYHLKKNPKVLKKLLNELKSSGIRKEALDDNGFSSAESIQLISKCDYLNYVVKETLRINPPTQASTSYEALTDITICGVPISKGTQIYINIVSCHYNPKEWHEPKKFIPERFDSNSEYFCKPGTNESRGAYSYIPFSIGPRACPGLSFAMIEIKTLLAYLLCRVDYEIDEDYMTSEHVFFELEGDVNLPGKITKKFHY